MTKCLTRRSALLGIVATTAILTAPAVHASNRGIAFIPDEAVHTAMLVKEGDHKAFCHCLRDIAYGNKIGNMDKNLHVRIHWLAEYFKADEVFIVSGFRTQKHQDDLRKRSPQLPKKSFHSLAKAADFRFIRGGTVIKPQVVSEIALKARLGGVGFYDDFTHLDTGRIRSW